MKHGINRSKFLEEHELHNLTACLDFTLRDSCLIALALATGARATELLNVQPNDLFESTQSVLIRGLKGGRDREIPLRPELFKAIVKHIPFNIKYRRLAYIWRNYYPGPKTFHSLRHTFALNLYRKHKDLKLVQLALGHVSPTNTAIYADFVYSQEQMRKIID